MSDQMRDPTSPIEPERWEALARFMAGESSPAEAASVRAWLAEDPARAGLVESLDRSTRHLAWTPPADLDVEAALNRVKTRMAESVVLSLDEARARRERLGNRGLGIRIAAAITIVAGAALVWRATQSVGGSGLTPKQYATSIGQTDTVSLVDGTQVILGPDTRLIVDAGYNRQDRSVELTGEALFDVRHDASKRFTVHAGNAVIEDLGTTFAVRSDVANQVRVVVTAGSVRLQSAENPEGSIVLRAGDRGVLNPDGRPTAANTQASEADLAWTQHRLTFTETPLDEVGSELHRWYGIELRIADPELRQRRLTTTFQGETRQQVLDIIALTVGARIEQRGDTVVMHVASGAPAR